MTITALPTLDRTSATFKTDVDDFFSTDLPTFVTEANALGAAADADATAASASASAASTSAANAAASESIAVASANATTWVSGTTYSLHDVAISPSNHKPYIRIVAGAGTTDPSADATNWQAYTFELAGDTTPQLNGTLDCNGNDIDNPSFTGEISEEVYALSGTTPALDPANGTVQTWTLSGNSTPTDSLTTGQFLTLMIDDGTAYTITWPSVTWKSDSGTAPTLNTTGYTAVQLWKVGSTLYGARVGNA